MAEEGAKGGAGLPYQPRAAAGRLRQLIHRVLHRIMNITSRKKKKCEVGTSAKIAYSLLIPMFRIRIHLIRIWIRIFAIPLLFQKLDELLKCSK